MSMDWLRRICRNGAGAQLRLMLAVSLMLYCPLRLAAQDSTSEVNTLKRLSLDELMNIEVNLVSKTAQKLSEVPSAIQVITSEDIRRSGATRLPEALRLASNLMIAQSNSHDWAVTARGFNGAPLANNTLANKLLVMIDGRTIYSVLFGGVFWDVQNLLLEDIDRVEIVSGPGGTLWGANAVNGVINIVTKSSRDSRGIFASLAVGDYQSPVAELRYGAAVNSKLSYRIYGRYAALGHTRLTDSTDANDAWNTAQGGFRLDYESSARNSFMLSGDYYRNIEGDPETTKANGQNVLGKWTHRFNGSSSLVAQVYFDRTWRDFPIDSFSDDLKTYNVDLQYGLSLGRRHRLLCGLEYRFMQDHSKDAKGLTFFPEDRNLQLFTGFVQDQVTIVPNRLDLTLGTRLLYNDYSHTDYQPSVRLAYTPSEKHVLWAAVSRAVRTPTRFDADERTSALATPGQNFASEKEVSYELGLRTQFSRQISFSLAAFHSRYTDLRSININRNAPPMYIFANDQQGSSSGFEISGNYWFSNTWRVRGGYTLFDKKITSDNPDVIPGSDAFEGIDPRHQFVLQSILDLPKGFNADVVLRYVSTLYSSSIIADVPEYFGLDIRLAKTFKWMELAIVGQNLLQDWHAEFGSTKIPRSVYARLSFRLLK